MVIEEVRQESNQSIDAISITSNQATGNIVQVDGLSVYDGAESDPHAIYSDYGSHGDPIRAKRVKRA